MPDLIVALISIACVISAILLLITLTITDLKRWLLPNIYVLPFAITGLIFHLSNDFYFLDSSQLFLGTIIGGGLLLAIRTIANSAYKQETLGLGDVKLMGAAGIWLGVEGVLFAITAGAMCGLLHGIAIFLYKRYRLSEKISFRKMSLPAGPGFILGIVITASLEFEEFIAFIQKSL